MYFMDVILLKKRNLNFILEILETDDVFNLNWFTNVFYLPCILHYLYNFWQKIFIIIVIKSHHNMKSHHNEAMIYYLSSAH